MRLLSREAGQEWTEVCKPIRSTETKGTNMRKAEGIYKDSGVTEAVID